MKITKEQFKELVGDNPEDILGQDWQNTVQEWLIEEEYACSDCGHTPITGACFSCKQD